MVTGLLESMRSEFQRQLRPMKGGVSGVAVIKRKGVGAQRGSWITGETVNVHYEQTRTEGGAPLDYSVSGAPGYTVYLDGRPATAVGDGDLFEIVGGPKLQVLRENEAGNLTPIASYSCEVAR